MAANDKPTWDRWFENSLLSGFFLTFFVSFAVFYFWPHRDINTFWPALGISSALAVAVPVLTNILGKKSTARLVKCCCASLLFSLMANGTFGSIMAMSLVDSFNASGTMSEFAARDFDDFDHTAAGDITSAQLAQKVQEQDQVRAALKQLDQVDKALGDLPVSGPAKFLAQGGLVAARAELNVNKLSDNAFDRLLTVKRFAYEAGRPISSPNQGATPNGGYLLNRDELLNYRTHLATKYPLWTWVLSYFHWI